VFYAHYLSLKSRFDSLNTPIFFGDSALMQQNTNVTKVPCLFIETPSQSQITYKGNARRIAPKAQFKLEYISDALYKKHDTPAQTASIEAHETVVRQLLTLLDKWQPIDPSGNMIAQQFIPVQVQPLQFSTKYILTTIIIESDCYI
jgi:hypothetical protein